jgi:hypothetical protein
MIGCEPGFTAQYSIKISSGIGGTVTVPGEGVFRYPAGTVVNLVAEEDRGYVFGSWLTNAQTIADASNATTTVTLTRNFYFVIAHFRD